MDLQVLAVDGQKESHPARYFMDSGLTPTPLVLTVKKIRSQD
jgi:hypothetical protein